MDPIHLPKVLLNALDTGVACHPLHTNGHGFYLHREFLLKSSHCWCLKIIRTLIPKELHRLKWKQGCSRRCPHGRGWNEIGFWSLPIQTLLG